MNDRRLTPLALAAILRLFKGAALFCLVAGTLHSQAPPRQVITHEGPLVLTGNQVYTIENATFIQHGPIEVRDQAKLVIRDSTVEFRQDYHDQFQWRFYDSAQLIVERSTVNSAQAHVVNLFGSSRAQVSASELNQAEIIGNDTATVSIADSTLGGGVVIAHQQGSAEQFPAVSVSKSQVHGLDFRLLGRPTGTVRGLRDHGYVTWTANELKDARMSVQVTNTWVDASSWAIGGDGRITFWECDLQSVGAADSAVVSVRNSHLYRAEMQFENSHRAALRGLISGQAVAHWSLHEADPAANVPFEYIVDNSQIDGWHIRVRGDLTLEDCDLHGSRLRPEFNTSKSIVRVIRTYVDDLMLWWSYGTVAFEDSTVGLVRNPAEATPTITGTVRFVKKAIDTENGPWRQATVTRQFPVRVVDRNGVPRASVPLRLYGPDGNVVWTGQSSPDGNASFDIVFTDANYDKTWSLRLGTDDPGVPVPVQFLSDTPLIVTTPVPASMDNGALNGRYNFIQLLAAPTGETRTLAGAISFDGKGAFTYAAVDGSGLGQGTYSLGGAGNVTLLSPIRSQEYLSAYLNPDRDVLMGASTYTLGSTFDFFVAVRAPSASVTNRLLNGSYTGALLEFAPGATPLVKSALVSLAAGADGRFSRASVTGHASDQGGRTVNQSIANATYSLKPGGNGTASFGIAASLLAGDREIFVSQDGTYLIGHLAGRGVLVALKTASAGAQFKGRYWIAQLLMDGPSWSADSGSLRVLGNGRALLAERRRSDGRVLDYAGFTSYAENPDGTGALAPRLAKGLTNMGLAAPVSVGGNLLAGAFVGAQVAPVGESTTQYGIFFGVRAPDYQGTGVVLDPAGVVNGVSFAGWPHPVAPGAIVSLFGSGLAAREARATAYPLPTKLDDVTVTINGNPAPLYFVSPTQANIQLPYGLQGSWVKVRVTNDRGTSNEVTAPLAATSPGVFFYSDSQSPYRGVVLHADYSRVTPQKPARLGETVMIWLTGLGELSPGVAAGQANPAAPLARAVDSSISVLFGGVPATRVDYAGGAPGFAGLSQINATIPLSSPVGSNVLVAISTGNAYTELVEIPISR